MDKKPETTEAADANTSQSAGVIRNAESIEHAEAHGTYYAMATGPVEERREEYVALRDKIARLKKRWPFIWRLAAASAMASFALIPMEKKWNAEAPAVNLVTTVGKNFGLDTILAGSAYTAAWFLGLISSVTYTAVAVGDTMASHAGWVEAGVANAPTYSQATRPAPSWSAASAGSKATSAALTFSITSTGTVKGCFLTTISTKDGITGTLYSAGTFTGGDKVLANGDTLSVSYTATL